MLEALLALLPTLEPQPLHFRHGTFTWDAALATWTPAPEPQPQEFPLLMAATPRLRLSEDLRTATWELVLLYAEPHLPHLADVPHIHHRGLRLLQHILLQLPPAADAHLAQAPELTFFQHSGPQRLAGAQAVCALTAPNAFSHCC